MNSIKQNKVKQTRQTRRTYNAKISPVKQFAESFRSVTLYNALTSRLAGEVIHELYTDTNTNHQSTLFCLNCEYSSQLKAE